VNQQMTASIRPVIVIGAARSGTRFLRDALAESDTLVPIDHDVSFVWRLGNHRHPHDEFTPELATPKIAKRIRSRIDSLAPTAAHQEVVEKTVGNSLRIPFVKAIYPDARVLVVTRDGREVIQSSHAQWTGGDDWQRWASKLPIFRPADLPYLAKVGAGLVRARVQPESSALSPRVWGVRYDGLEDDLASRGVAWVAGQQWLRCLESTANAMRNGIDAVVTNYQELCDNPHEMKRIANALDIPDADRCASFIADTSRPSATGPWSSFLDDDVRASLDPILERGQELITEMESHRK